MVTGEDKTITPKLETKKVKVTFKVAKGASAGEKETLWTLIYGDSLEFLDSSKKNTYNSSISFTHKPTYYIDNGKFEYTREGYLCEGVKILKGETETELTDATEINKLLQELKDETVEILP